MDLKTHAAIKLCRVLPPPLAYRLHYRFFSKIVGSSERFYEPILFGHGHIAGTMKDMADAYFALHRTNTYHGMTVARWFINAGDTVFEFGANSGTETLALANLVTQTGQVVAIEPDPRLAARIRERIKLNGFSNVAIIQCAISDNTDPVSFRPGPEVNTGCGFTTKTDNRDSNSTHVNSITMDDLYTNFGKPRFVFMDIEGFEFNALAGGLRTLTEARPIFFSEVVTAYLERAGSSLKDLADLLSYSKYMILDAREWNTPRLATNDGMKSITTDCVFLPNELASRESFIRRLLLLARMLPKLRYLHPMMMY